MRILMITDFYWPYLGGVEQHVRTLSQELSKRGHEVMVATLHSNDSPSREKDGEVSIIRLKSGMQQLPMLYSHEQRPWGPPFPDPAVTKALRKIAQEFDPHIVHGHDWLAHSWFPISRAGATASPPFFLSLHYYTRSCARKTLMHKGQPCSGPAISKCFSCSIDNYGLKGPAIAAANWITLKRNEPQVSKYIAVSQFTARGNGIDPESEECEIIPNFIQQLPAKETEEDLQYLDQLPSEPFIMYVGDFRREKGLYVLLKAYERLDSPPPLVLIGKPWDDTPDEWPENVHTYHYWPNRAVLHAWKRSMFSVMPSIWPEPFGIVVIEAMLAGKPVVGAKSGGIPEIVDHNYNGLLVSPGDVDELVSAMRYLVDDEASRTRMGDQASISAESYYVQQVVSQIEQEYLSAIS